MNSLNRLRSSINRSFFSSKTNDSNSDLVAQEGFSILNRHFTAHKRFDLSVNSQQQFAASLETLNQINNTLSQSSTGGIERNGDNSGVVSNNKKRTL
ncbi:unnamed protein product, partial [Rotaria socialis]